MELIKTQMDQEQDLTNPSMSLEANTVDNGIGLTK